MGLAGGCSKRKRKKNDIFDFIEESDSSLADEEYLEPSDASSERTSEDSGDSESASDDDVESSQNEDEGEELEVTNELKAITCSEYEGIDLTRISRADLNSPRAKRVRSKVDYLQLEIPELDKLAVEEEEISNYNALRKSKKGVSRTRDAMPSMVWNNHDPETSDPYDEEPKAISAFEKPTPNPHTRAKDKSSNKVLPIVGTPTTKKSLQKPKEITTSPRKVTTSRKKVKTTPEKAKTTSEKVKTTPKQVPAAPKRNTPILSPHVVQYKSAWHKSFDQAKFLANLGGRNDCHRAVIALEKIVHHEVPENYGLAELQKATHDVLVLFRKRLRANSSVITDADLFQEIEDLPTPRGAKEKDKIMDVLRDIDRVLLLRLVMPLSRMD